MTLCFYQPVKGGSKINLKKKKSRANAVNEANTGRWHLLKQSVVPGDYFAVQPPAFGTQQ